MFTESSASGQQSGSEIGRPRLAVFCASQEWPLWVEAVQKNAGARFFCRSKAAVAASTGPFRLAEKSETRAIVVWRAGLSVFTQPRS
jgi:hypothetical protein